VSVFVLIALCWLFYWRLLTPNPANQQSLVEGDFSGQFVAFAHYQATRLARGEVPLWNPYNYGGHPFLADTQSAVFYPPRLLTIALLNALGGSNPQRMYAALQIEMVSHALLASLLMYAFVRRLTNAPDQSPSLRSGEGDLGGEVPSRSIIAALVSAITFAYGGYLTGYPQLQLAVMEAAIWLPLALLGIHEATRNPKIGWRSFVASGLALGFSLLAGHPQTSLFFGSVTLAYLGWRVVAQRRSWRIFVAGAAIFGLIGVGIAAVQLLPGLEYTRLTVRAAINVDAAGNGFPFYDILQMIFPGILSLWSPLYFGIVGLMLAIYAMWRRVEGVMFWLVLGGIALVLSFGRNTILYDFFYHLIPGFSLFRGQERAAYIVMVAASILAGLGARALLTSPPGPALTPYPSPAGEGSIEREPVRQGDVEGEVNPLPRGYRQLLWAIVALAFGLGAALFVNWLTTPGVDSKRLQLVTFSLIVSLLAALLLTLAHRRRWMPFALVALVAFELFSFGRTNPNLESKPPGDRLRIPPIVQTIQADDVGIYRVDGRRGIRENYGTLYGVMDIRGISPLRLLSVDRLLSLPPGRLWETLAVRYVVTENMELPVPSKIIARGEDPGGPINLHQLADPRPFARLVFRHWIEADDNAALGILAEPSYDARNSVILPAQPRIDLPAQPPSDATAEVMTFTPERIVITTRSSAPGILSISQIYYPGWQAMIEGSNVEIMRADTALMAVSVPAGEHTIQLIYDPVSYKLGALVSILTLIFIGILGVSGLATSVFASNRRANSDPAHS
jgi:hypothetical protein